MIIGITGNSGSGKSAISKLISQKINAKIIDADEVVRKIAQPGNEYYEKQLELFGEEIVTNNKLDRKKIAEIIYNNSEKRSELNTLTYKYVVDEIKKEVENTIENNIIIDAPLLFESGLNKICDYTIGVLANNMAKVARICNRDNIDENTAISRLKIQENDAFYINKADYIVENNGKIDEINLEEICTKIGMN